MATAEKRDYSLIGPAPQRAAEQGLVAADWYHPEVPRKRMKELMRRRDGPALRDTALWLALLVGFGFAGGLTWGTWLTRAVLPRLRRALRVSHRLALARVRPRHRVQDAWLNDVLYQVASFMNMKEPTFWRWSHARHHTDTIIVGRDREIAAMRPPDVARLVVNVLGLRDAWDTAISVGRHAAGRLTAEERTFIPEGERFRVYREARAWVAIYVAVVALAHRPAAHSCRSCTSACRRCTAAGWPRCSASRSTPGWPRTCSTTASTPAPST